MKNIFNNNLVKFASLGLITVMGLAACSDDHFDVQNFDSSGTTTKTIMENLSGNNELGDFVNILSRTRVKRNETDKKSTMTYAELLNSPQTYTVWAPKNGTYDPSVYLEMLNEADELRAKGKVDDAVKLEYRVENQFVKNHIARFNYENVAGQQKVRMLNSKVYTYDAGSSTFNGVEQALNADLVSCNGAIHVLNSPSKYFHSIFDYLDYDKDFSDLYAIIMEEDTTMFDEGQSVPGTLNQEGNMVYVDSVYRNENVFLDNSKAQIKNEDSLYIAVIPTNEGLEDAIEKMRSYFNYGDSYNYDWKNNTKNPEKSTFDKKGYKPTANALDSAVSVSVLTNMYISATNLSCIEDKADSASVIEGIRSLNTDKDSLISTNGVIFYNPAKMFASNPIKASNGYIFKSDTYQVDPQTSFLMATKSTFTADTYCRESKINNVETITVSSETRDSTVFGELYNNTYVRIMPRAKDAQMEYRLPAVYSGEYKISVELVPANISTRFNGDVGMPQKFNATIIYDDDSESDQVDVTFDKDSIHQVVLWENFKFKKCYAGLPSDITSFPRLRFTMPERNLQNAAGEKRNMSLNISRIIIEPAKSVTSVTPEGEN